MKLIIPLVILSISFSQSTYSTKPTAEQLAEKVMRALGGEAAWNETHFLTWNFFGKRLHVWDKWTNNARIEMDEDVILYNLNSNEGKLFRSGKEIANTDSVSKYVAKAKMLWNNDAYWLFMPYKLTDNGVNLKRIEDAAAESGEDCYRLQLTFEKVGDTPENKYFIYIRKSDDLVVQWDFFTKFSDDKPRFSTPWDNWKDFGKIKLSDNRGKYLHTDINVLDNISDEIFNSANKIDLNELIKGK